MFVPRSLKIKRNANDDSGSYVAKKVKPEAEDRGLDASGDGLADASGTKGADATTRGPTAPIPGPTGPVSRTLPRLRARDTGWRSPRKRAGEVLLQNPAAEPSPGEPVCVVCAGRCEYVCDETDEGVCSLGVSPEAPAAGEGRGSGVPASRPPEKAGSEAGGAGALPLRLHRARLRPAHRREDQIETLRRQLGITVRAGVPKPIVDFEHCGFPRP